MSREQAELCLSAGVHLAQEAVKDGADLIGTGEMGIGNTTPSSAIVSVMTGESPERTTGKGTGRTPAEPRARPRLCDRRSIPTLLTPLTQ